MLTLSQTFIQQDQSHTDSLLKVNTSNVNTIEDLKMGDSVPEGPAIPLSRS